MPTKVEKDVVTGTETTGHEWDGLKELNTPLPTWWVYSFYATILFAIGYCIAYPSIPWFTGHTDGMLGYSTRGAVEKSLVDAAQQQAKFRDRIKAASLDEIRKDSELFNFANIGGKAAFNENCAPC